MYARVVSASRDLEPQLSCVDALGRASGMGALKDGVLAGVTTSHARALLASPPAPVLQVRRCTCVASLSAAALLGAGCAHYRPLPRCVRVLQALGASLQYEVAVGMNGRLWVCAPTPRATVLAANAITASEFLTPLQVTTLVGKLVESQVQ